MKITEKQSEAYFYTDYRVFTPEGVMVLPALGAEYFNMGKLLNKFGVSTAAFITAYNPGSVQVDDAINASRQDELKKEVSAKWQFFEGEGVAREGGWPPEPSIFVLGIKLDDARVLGLKYGQLAILFCTDNGETCLKACDPEDQASLVHPLGRMAERMEAEWRAAGITVEKIKPVLDGKLTAHFIFRGWKQPKQESVDEFCPLCSSVIHRASKVCESCGYKK